VKTARQEHIAPPHRSGATADCTFELVVDNHPDDRPGDRFNEKADLAEILEPSGWLVVGTSGTERRWRCPYSDNPPEGHCATTGHREADTLHVFCGAKGMPFEGDQNYSKFGAYALLYHGGDHTAAAALRTRGYGSHREVDGCQAVATVPDGV
jgi:putative DNA primase/helicase